MSGAFDDIMGLVEVGERMAEGESWDEIAATPDAGSKRGRERKERARGGKVTVEVKDIGSPATPARCSKAPPGYQCNGRHNAVGQCMDLTLLEEPEIVVEGVNSP